VDAGDHSFVRVLDAATLSVVAEVSTPLGSAGVGLTPETQFPLGIGTFTSDGIHFAMELSAPNVPDDIYLVDAHSGAFTPLRREPRAGAEGARPIRASIERVTAFDGLVIPINVYLPEELPAGKRLPTLVVFHGGPDKSSSLEWNGFTRVLLSFGFAVLEPNIRGSTGFGRAYELADNREKRADSWRDVATVNAWARRQSWCDSERLVIEGGSYGGYVTLMGLAQQPRLWRAGVDLAGITDLELLGASAGAAGNFPAEFGDPKQDAALLAELSPIHHAAEIALPLFVYQGQNDDRVPRAHADSIVRALRARHVPVEYMVARNEGHTLDRRENQVEFLARAIRFLQDELDLSH
jgi:dipeptidyl aminopeptidase/acylaminoacyl peptidase